MARSFSLCLFSVLFSMGLFGQNLDRDYGVDGIAILEGLAPNLYPRDITTDQQGAAFVLCENLDFQDPLKVDTSLFVIKVSPDGSIDTSFGENGLSTVHFPREVWASAIFVSGTNLFITGRVASSFSSTARTYLTDFIVAINLEDGNLITSFGNAGLIYTEDLDEIKDQVSVTATVLGDHMYLAGLGNDTVLITSLDASGLIDPNFGDSGVLKIPFSGGSLGSPVIRTNEANTALYVFTPIDTETGFTKYEYACTALNLKGSVDSTFGTKGSTYAPAIEGGFGSPPRLIWTSIDTQNIYLTVSTFSNNESKYYRSKISTDGVLDTRMGNAGLLEIPESQSRFFISSDNTIYTSGSSNSNQVIAAFRDNSEPHLDFGTNGIYEVNTSATSSEASTELTFLTDSVILGLGHIIADNVFIPTLFKLSNTLATSILTGLHPKEQNPFPNPAQNVLHLPNELSSQNLKLYNSQGQQFNVVQPDPGQLDLSHLAPGMYVLQAGERMWRFVKE